MLPRIEAGDERVGFHWCSPDGAPMRLVDVIALPDAEPDRWLPTHLEALDDVLIDVAGRYGEVLGGGRGPGRGEHDELAAAYRAIDRLCHEYAEAQRVSGLPDDLRAGQIVGTAALMSIRLRDALAVMAPAPFDGSLDVPEAGVVGGHARLEWVFADDVWRGARWVVTTQSGRRLPATLGMLLHDSSGVNREASLDEHRDALTRVTAAVTGVGAEPMAASGAIDWLLFDWVMAHRESADSGAVEIGAGGAADARMIVLAAEASAVVRSRFDVGLLDR